MKKNDKIFSINNLSKYYESGKGIFSQKKQIIKAVDNVSFSIYKGETLGLVGESGCGKTTVGRCLLRGIEPTSGSLIFKQGNDEYDLVKISHTQIRNLRRYFQMIFQDPFSSLNSRWTVFDIISEPLISILNIKSTKEREHIVSDMMVCVGLRPEYMRRYPHSFSGGERQRIGIARALITNPSFIVADEPVSALDVSVRAQTLNLMHELQTSLQLTYLFISHDLSVVEYLCDRIIVMYVGNIIEIANTENLFNQPLHPYTEALISAIPCRHPDKKQKRIILQGDIADPVNLPTGCAFHPRCKYAKEICTVKTPELKSFSDTHHVRCHFASELHLSGRSD